MPSGIPYKGLLKKGHNVKLVPNRIIPIQFTLETWKLKYYLYYLYLIAGSKGPLNIIKFLLLNNKLTQEKVIAIFNKTQKIPPLCNLNT